ncbi:hypothetical protein F4778DRAFT_715277 [Xylariomycetidae sp. FL2044]|nr:hypothetical protein F4778DRAFT_715277 [Xylariomycetidae sp. FL2044]
MDAASGPSRSRPLKTVEDLRSDPDIDYRLKALLFDLCHVKEHTSQRRLEQTTDSLYISSPYFTPEQAIRVREAATCRRRRKECEYEYDPHENNNNNNNPSQSEEEDQSSAGLLLLPLSVQDAITRRLENFLEKRRASGDARPCGPHDLAPVYLEVFGIADAELRDERFLRRLGGGGNATNERSKTGGTNDRGKKKKGQKRGGKKRVCVSS